MKKISFLPLLALVLAVAGAFAFSTKAVAKKNLTSNYYWFEYAGQDANGLIPGTFVDGPKQESEMLSGPCDDSGTPLCLLGYRSDQVNTSGTPEVIQNSGVYEQPESEGAKIHETEP